MPLRAFVLSLMIAVLLLACGMDPESQRDRFMAAADKYNEAGNHKEASILYRRALQFDRRFAEAYYKLGLVSLELKEYPRAVHSLRRAFELDPDNLDAFRKLAEIYFAAVRAPSRRGNEATMDTLIQLSESAQRKHPAAKEVLHVKGRIMLADERFEEALSPLEEAYKLDSQDSGFAMALALAHLRLGRIDVAAEILREYIERCPKQEEPYDLLYRTLAASGDVEGACSALEAKTKALPDDPANWLALAAHYRSQGQAGKVEETLLHLTRDLEKFPDAWLMIGDYYVMTGDPMEAVEAYQRGREGDPKSRDTFHYKIVYAYLTAQDFPAASEQIDKILAKGPEDPRAIGLRGILRLAAGGESQMDAALADLRTAVSELPDNVPLRYQYGRALLMSGDFRAARTQLDETTNRNSKFLPAQYSLLDLHLLQGEFSDAELTAERILDESPFDASARLALAVANTGRRQFDEARRNLTLLLEQKQRIPDALWELGRLNLMEQRYGEAERCFRDLTEIQPPDRRGAQGLLDLYLVQNRLPEARKLVNEALQDQPENPNLLVMAGRLALAAGDRAGGKETLESALRLDPKHEAASRHLADAAIHDGDTQRAKRYLQAAMEAESPNPVVYYRYGTILAGEGNIRDARTYLEKSVELSPGNADALNNLAYVLADSGADLDMAVTYAQRAISTSPDNNDYADTLAYVYIKKNLYGAAIELLTRIVEKDPRRGDYRYHLGLALFRSGQQERAAEELRAAQALALSKNDAKNVRSLLKQIGD